MYATVVLDIPFETFQIDKFTAQQLQSTDELLISNIRHS